MSIMLDDDPLVRIPKNRAVNGHSVIIRRNLKQGYAVALILIEALLAQWRLGSEPEVQVSE